VGALREAGVALALFSDGFDLQVGPLAEAIGARFVFANTLFVEGDALTGEIDLTFDPAQKGALAGEALAALGAAPEECIRAGLYALRRAAVRAGRWSAAIAALRRARERGGDGRAPERTCAAAGEGAAPDRRAGLMRGYPHSARANENGRAAALPS